MGFHQTLTQRESNSGMVVRPGRRRLEHSKYSFLIGGRNAGPVVRYRQFAVPADVLRTYVDVSGRSIVVFDRIADEIAQHALERCLDRLEGLRINPYRYIEAARARQNSQDTIDEL